MRVARGALHAMVSVAMAIADHLEQLTIETDEGVCFCRREIAYISLLDTRPR